MTESFSKRGEIIKTRKEKKKMGETMRNDWMSINPNKGLADKERMIQHCTDHTPTPGLGKYSQTSG